MTENRISVSENGPYGAEGDLDVGGETCGEAWLCRCGHSQDKPFCDGSHKLVGFADPGEPAPQQGVRIEPTGPLKIRFAKNGPILVSGAFNLVSASGRLVANAKKAALCRCGRSQTKPFCDGTHSKVEFQAD